MSKDEGIFCEFYMDDDDGGLVRIGGCYLTVLPRVREHLSLTFDPVSRPMFVVRRIQHNVVVPYSTMSQPEADHHVAIYVDSELQPKKPRFEAPFR